MRIFLEKKEEILDTEKELEEGKWKLEKSDLSESLGAEKVSNIKHKVALNNEHPADHKFQYLGFQKHEKADMNEHIRSLVAAKDHLQSRVTKLEKTEVSKIQKRLKNDCKYLPNLSDYRPD